MLMLFVTITSVLTRFIEGRAICFFLLFIKVLFICSILSARPTMIKSQSAEIIIIDDFHPVFTETLGNNQIRYIYQPDFKSSDAPEQLKGYKVVVVRSKVNFTKEILEQLPELKCIARGGAGMDNIDEQFALSKGIILLNAPEGNRDAVAEHTLGLLLGMSKNIVKSSREVANFIWEREANRGWEIGGKTIGIVGYGNAGSAFSKKLSGFDCEVIAYDKFKSDFKSEFASSVSMDELLERSDVISFHVPLTPETKGLLNAELIDKMKKGVVLMNTSRGKVAISEDVLNGIKRGKVKSFATDVLENEDLENLNLKEKMILQEMITENQVIITPHIAGWSKESYQKISEVLVEKLIGITTKWKNI